MENIQNINECPDCASTNIVHGLMREQVICRDCGLIFESLAPQPKKQVIKPKPMKKIKKKAQKKTKKKAKKKTKKKLAKKKPKKRTKKKKQVKKKPKKKAKKKKK